MYRAIAFKGRSRSATGSSMPPGVDKASISGTHTTFANVEKKFAPPRVSVMNVWLCECQEGKEPRKLRVIHEATGPTAPQQCQDFIAMWRDDSPQAQQPCCPADGKSIKPNLDPAIQPCLL